jgi:spermidine synthase
MDERPAAEPAEVVARSVSPRGELVLRRAGGHYELISNGVFLMDSRDGTSERALVRGALDTLDAGSEGRRRGGRTVLLGGLGMGFSLLEALATERVAAVTVVEVEPEVIAWHRTHLRGVGGGAIADPRVTVIAGDLAAWLRRQRGQGQFDAVCLDVDNGPDWTVTDSNAWLYGSDGLGLLRRALRPGGVLAVWSSAAAPRFLERLRRVFGGAETVEVPSRVAGAPDVIFLARRSWERARPLVRDSRTGPSLTMTTGSPVGPSGPDGLVCSLVEADLGDEDDPNSRFVGPPERRR